MQKQNNELSFVNEVISALNNIGVGDENKTNRLGYSRIEDRMHHAFMDLGEKLGCHSYIDEVGNSFVCNTNSNEYILIGSHLDSVVDGGRYDGVAGVIAGLLLLKLCKDRGLNTPIRVAAFRCEESSNFGVCTIGSGLVTGEEFAVDLPSLKSLDGISLGEIFREKDYSFNPPIISGVKEYLELHIEQGRVLEDKGVSVGIVGNIAGPRRLAVTIKGLAEHSGATPMDIRNDALCGAAELILDTESIGNSEAKFGSVATIGLIKNAPNVMNVIPGEVYLGVDLRGTEVDSIDRMESKFREAAVAVAKKRGLTITIKNIGGVPPVKLSSEITNNLVNAAKKLGTDFITMPSGATHDCASFGNICPAGLVFIPCKRGISHNPLEDCRAEDIVIGTEVLYTYLANKK